MKRLVLSGLLVLSSLGATAQFYDYSSATGWTFTQNLYTTPPACPLLPLSTLSGAGTISISSGVVNFRDILGAHEARLSTWTGNFYDKEFIMDFEMNITSTSGGKAIYAAVLTSQDLIPDIALPVGPGCVVAPNMDVLGVRVYTTDPYSPSGLVAGIGLYDNGTNLTPTNTIAISYGTTYYVRVPIYGNKHGELQIYSDPNRTALVGSFCFDIPETVNGLTFLQHTTLPLAGYIRSTRAWVDNTNIYEKDFDCCRYDVIGSNVIYHGAAAEYSIYGLRNPEISFNYSDIDYAVSADGILTVHSWGDLSFGPRLVAIRVVGICQCELISYIKYVYVYPGEFGPGLEMPLIDQNGREDVTPAEQLQIYPNPTTGVVSIDHTEVIKEVVLLDGTGTVMGTFAKDSKSVQIDISSHPSGVYTLKITTATGTTVERVIKK